MISILDICLESEAFHVFLGDSCFFTERKTATICFIGIFVMTKSMEIKDSQTCSFVVSCWCCHQWSTEMDLPRFNWELRTYFALALTTSLVPCLQLFYNQRSVKTWCLDSWLPKRIWNRHVSRNGWHNYYDDINQCTILFLKSAHELLIPVTDIIRSKTRRKHTSYSLVCYDRKSQIPASTHKCHLHHRCRPERLAQSHVHGVGKTQLSATERSS